MAATVIRQNQALIVPMISLDFYFGHMPPHRGTIVARVDPLAQARVRRASLLRIGVLGEAAYVGEHPWVCAMGSEIMVSAITGRPC